MAVRDDRPATDVTLIRVREGESWSDATREKDFAVPGRSDLPGLPCAGHTPLLRASHGLLSLASSLRDGAAIDDMSRLHERAVEAIGRFEDEARDAGIEARTMTTARYVLCTMLDEAVLHVAWRDSVHWRRRTLLLLHHGDTYGGETFFVILNRVLSDISRHIDLAELLYACLALGFGGRYLVEEGGAARLAKHRETLYRQIVACRGDDFTALSLRWRGVDRPGRPQGGPCPWVTGLCTAMLLFIAWGAFRWLLADLHAGTMTYLHMATEPFPLPPTNAPSPATQVAIPGIIRARTARTLEQLLAADPARSQMDIRDEADGRTTVRLGAGGMFRSGGVDVATPHQDILRRIAVALNQLQGQVLIVGHTDDQPIHTARYRDNAELSLARARAVAAVLIGELADPGRVSFHGAGDSRPVAIPPERPEHRLLNRRVEIVFVPEAS